MNRSRLQIMNVMGKDIYIRIEDELDFLVHTETIEKATDWIKENIIPHKCSCINYKYNSYLLKHIVENNIGRYVNNGQLKLIMAQLDFYISHKNSYLNPSFNIDDSFFRIYAKKRKRKKLQRFNRKYR